MKEVLATILQAASEPGSTVPLTELGALLYKARYDHQPLTSCSRGSTGSVTLLSFDFSQGTRTGSVAIGGRVSSQ